MDLADLVSQIDGFDKFGGREKIQIFAWFLHSYGGRDILFNADIRACFDRIHIADPNVAKYLPRMLEYGDLIKAGVGFKLQRQLRLSLDSKFGVHHTVVQVSKLLAELPSKLTDNAEIHFLNEAIKCYRVEAYRACVVMSWNLAYSHLLGWILKDHNRLDTFNSAITQRYAKKTSVNILLYDDFTDELKESEVIEICKTGGLISGNIAKILREKLDKRNIAAHLHLL